MAQGTGSMRAAYLLAAVGVATLLRREGGNSTLSGPVPPGGVCNGDAIHCVKVASLPADFCDVTGQSNWCSSYVGSSWCICDWAYTSYTSKGHSLSIDCSGVAPHCKSLTGC